MNIYNAVSTFYVQVPTNDIILFSKNVFGYLKICCLSISTFLIVQRFGTPCLYEKKEKSN